MYTDQAGAAGEGRCALTGFVESVGSAGEGTVCTDGIEYSGKEAVCEMEGDVHVRRGFMCIVLGCSRLHRFWVDWRTNVQT